jgi:hypothetical protein
LTIDTVSGWGNDVEVDVAVAGDCGGNVCLSPGPDHRRICEVSDLDAYGRSVGPPGYGLGPAAADGMNFAGLAGGFDHEHSESGRDERGRLGYTGDVESKQNAFHAWVVIRLKGHVLSVDPVGTTVLEKGVLGGRERGGGRRPGRGSARKPD